MGMERSNFLHAKEENLILSDQNKVIPDLTSILTDFLPSICKRNSRPTV
jgi:hypothetical protein